MSNYWLCDHYYGKPYCLAIICGDREWCKRRCKKCNCVENFYRIVSWRPDRWEVVLDREREEKLISEAIEKFNWANMEKEGKIKSMVTSWSH
jgi:hypothetical protein